MNPRLFHIAATVGSTEQELLMKWRKLIFKIKQGLTIFSTEKRRISQSFSLQDQKLKGRNMYPISIYIF